MDQQLKELMQLVMDEVNVKEVQFVYKNGTVSLKADGQFIKQIYDNND